MSALNRIAVGLGGGWWLKQAPVSISSEALLACTTAGERLVRISGKGF